jgi:hypothetical protein
MSRCRDIAAAVVDERLPRPADFDAHVAGCPECAALARLHASASRLRLPAPPPLAPVPRSAIVGEVRRRQHRRRMATGAVASVSLAALVLLGLPRAQPVRPTGEPASAREVVPLTRLMDEVSGYTRRDLSVSDETYAPFGQLALWVRPPGSTALEARPFRAALAPLQQHNPKQEEPR